MFVKYLHLERLDNPNVEGILHGTCAALNLRLMALTLVYG